MTAMIVARDSVEQKDSCVRLLGLLKKVYDQGIYSDLEIFCNGHSFKGHRLVLVYHSDYWGDLKNENEVKLEVDHDYSSVIFKWMYTLKLSNDWGPKFLLKLLQITQNYHFYELSNICIGYLIEDLDVDNSIFIYQIGTKLGLEDLINPASFFISSNWGLFKSEHFKDIQPDLLLELILKHCSSVIHSIIRFGKKDVLDLYFEKHLEKVAESINLEDEDDLLPLDIAFSQSNLEIAQSLVDNGADLNLTNKAGKCFLAKAVESGNVSVLEFLVKNNVNLNYKNDENGRTLLHDLAAATVIRNEIQRWVKDNISLFDVNEVDSSKRTPLFLAISNNNVSVLELLLSHQDLNVNLRDENGKTPLEFAIFDQDDLTTASKMIDKGANIAILDNEGNTLLHRTVKECRWKVVTFLSSRLKNMNLQNKEGQTALDILLDRFPSKTTPSSIQLDILRLMLKTGADPLIVHNDTGSTAIHKAVSLHPSVIELLLSKVNGQNLSVRDRDNQTPLWVSLTSGHFDVAKVLVQHGADINEVSNDQHALLLRAVQERRDDIVDFLISNNANVDVKTSDGQSCLLLAVERGLTSTVDTFCKLGANMNLADPKNGDVPLWIALKNKDYSTAQVLVSHGCDLEAWKRVDGVESTLLQRAIKEKDVKVAVFLVKSGCDVNAIEKFDDQEFNTKSTPLHLSIKNELIEVSNVLISNLKCKVDAQDVEGNTCAHLALKNMDKDTLDLILAHPDPTPLTLCNKKEETPLAIAMSLKYNKAAEAICRRVPHAVLLVNSDGLNLLHIAVQNDDFESVLFLLSLQVNVNIATENNEQLCPLHISATQGNELIMRNLLLAGADPNLRDYFDRTPLHLAAMKDRVDHCRILVENGADVNLSDYDGNKAIHLAVLNGAVDTVQTLLLESSADPLATNHHKRNIVHLCAGIPGLASAEMFQTIIEIFPKYDLNLGDIDGNTAFLLSFINGNQDLSQLMLKYSTIFGSRNANGDSVFTLSSLHPNLLRQLLTNLDREPQWADGDSCCDCESRFTLTMRKHHCRHCGRLTCAKCSEMQMPILKFNLPKNVRVCRVCYLVLTTGKSETSEST